MQLRARSVAAVMLAGLWIGLSEFVRNQLLLLSIWQGHYASLHLVLPAEPVNAVSVWMVWSFAFSLLLFSISRRFTLLQTAG